MSKLSEEQDIAATIENTLGKLHNSGEEIEKSVAPIIEATKTLKNELEIEVSSNGTENINYSDLSDGFAEAQAVLNSLGYTSDEISLGLEAAIKNVSDKNDTQEILQKALSVISGS